MKRMVSALLLAFLFLSTTISASAREPNTGRYTAKEYFESESQSLRTKEIEQTIKNSKEIGYTEGFDQYQLTIYKVKNVGFIKYSQYEKNDSLTAIGSENGFDLYFTLNNKNEINNGIIRKADSNQNVIINGWGHFPIENFDNLAAKINSEIGKINEIEVLTVNVDIGGCYFVSVITDQDRYVIPYGADTSIIHLENEKIYTEKNVMEILMTFFDDPVFEKDNTYPGVRIMNKNPTEEQIKALGLTEYERNGVPITNSSSNVQQSSQIKPFDLFGAPIFYSLLLVIVVGLGLLLFIIKRKKTKV